ncbi:MAG: SHOCT domain-containing protein [Firmicutes bacterium]|nr:SHOCT domain-containing protein [Bacillota bacterium]
MKRDNILYSNIAGACFGQSAVNVCLELILYGSLIFPEISFSDCILYITKFVFYFIFAVIMLRSRRHIVEIIAAGLMTVINAYFTVINISHTETAVYFGLFSLAAAALTFLTVAFCIPSTASKDSTFKRIAQRIWFLPAVLLLIGSIFYYIWWFLYAYDNSFLVFIESCGVTLIFDIIEIAAYLFAGLWLSDGKFAVKREKSAAVPNAVKIGDADRLKICKELLDEGVITQDEFDEKKKQILGL